MTMSTILTNKLAVRQNGGYTESLLSLNNNLDGELITLTGDPKKIIPELLSESGATSVVWNRNYEPWQIEREIRQLNQH